ncbi:putative leucine-rich repeat domain superfamily [Tanacetum coccineum]
MGFIWLLLKVVDFLYFLYSSTRPCQLRRLEMVNDYRNNWVHALIKFPLLEELNLYSYNELPIAIGKTLHELRHLELIGSDMTNAALQAILDGCRHLDTRDLRGCVNIHLKGDLGKRCSEQIKYLKWPKDPLNGATSTFFGLFSVCLNFAKTVVSDYFLLMKRMSFHFKSFYNFSSASMNNHNFRAGLVQWAALVIAVEKINLLWRLEARNILRMHMGSEIQSKAGKFKNTSGYKKWQDKEKNEKDGDEKEKGVTANSCYHCGSFDHWAKHYDILDDPKDQTDATHLDDDDFLTNE